MNGKTIQCLPNPSQHVPIYLEYFPSYTMLKSMRKSKNRYFYHILVSPGDAPGAITLNVVWMEREFDAYKLSRCMCSSNYNRFWDRARYWSKNVIFIPPCIRRWNSATPFRMEKLEWLRYHMVKKFRRYLYLFWRNSRTWQTDGHRVPAIAALMHSIARQKLLNQCSRFCGPVSLTGAAYVQPFRRTNRKMTNVQLLAFFTLQPLSLDFTSHSIATRK